MLEDIPQAGENDPDQINPFKLGGILLAVFAFFVILAALGWPS